MFFSVDIAYTVGEIQSRRKLRRFLGISEVPTAESLYRFLNRFDEDTIISLITALLNSCCSSRRRKRQSTILIDGTAITLDLNWFRRAYSKKQLDEREYRWGYTPSHGYYIGYKLTLAVEYPSLRPVGMILHPGSPHDAPLFEEIMEELKRRRVLRIGDTVVCDKGYYSYGNYVQGILRYNVIPLIFSKKTFSVKKLLGQLIYPLNILGRSDTPDLIRRYRSLVRDLLLRLKDQDGLQGVRCYVEDVLKIAKNAFSLKRIHRYTTRSVKKEVSLNVLLTGLVISLGFRSKEQLQSLAEW